MHMAMVIFAGLNLLALSLLFAWLWGGATPDYAVAAKLFIPVWLCIAITNLWVGVIRAGYTVAQELPILLVVFGVPAALALFAMFRFAR